MNTTHAQSNTW